MWDCIKGSAHAHEASNLFSVKKLVDLVPLSEAFSFISVVMRSQKKLFELLAGGGHGVEIVCAGVNCTCTDYTHDVAGHLLLA